MPKTKNRGLILRPPSPQDWVFGGVSGLDNELPRSLDQNWTMWRPTFERQSYITPSNGVLETMSCVSQSYCNCLETLLNWYMGHNLLPEPHRRFLIDYGYFKNGQVNFSDRALAKMSDTSKRGNSGWVVAMTARKQGLIPENDWHWDSSQETWEDYYADIPADLLEKAEKFLEMFGLPFEFVYGEENLRNSLFFRPVQVYVKWTNIEIDGIKQHVNGEPNHAVELLATNGFDTLFDTYAGWPETDDSGVYRAALDYGMPSGLAVDLDFKSTDTPEIKPMIKLPNNSLVIVVDGLGERLMWATDKLYQDDPGKILLEVEARNAIDGKSAPFPIVHVKTSDLEGVARYNLKNQLIYG